jgi:hypothetical protein
MRTIIFLCAVVIAATFAMSASRGEGEEPELDEPDEVEPITGNPVMPLKGSETPMKDPFTPYDTGPGAWRFDDLTAAEKVVAARGLDEDQSQIQDRYADAARDRAERAKIEAAEAKLGIHNLGSIGGAL